MTPGAEDRFQEHAEGLLLRVRVSPGAKQTRLEGWETDAEGRPRLRLRISVPPQKGKANAAVLKLLAGAFGLRQNQLRLVSGESGRSKTVLIEGDAAALRARFEEVSGAPGGTGKT